MKRPQPRPLTLLQRGVIQRLRAIDSPMLAHLADCAHDAWRNGMPCASGGVHWPAVKLTDRDLREDFAKANEQALDA